MNLIKKIFIGIKELGNRLEFMDIITNTYVISLLLTFIIIYLLPPIFEKYSAKIIDEERKNDFPITYYNDLDNDGNSERILIHPTPDSNVGIMVYKDGGVIDQWNFKGEFVNEFDRGDFIYDFNNDGLKEIFQFTLYKDSIYFSCFNPIIDTVYFKEVPVTSYKKFNGNIDCSFSIVAFKDINGDGKKEIYFGLTAGHSAKPRNMYRYDYANNELICSMETCNHFLEPKAWDLNGDGKMEFWGASSATGNCDEDLPYSDYFSWLMVLDENLKFKFEPQIIGYFPSIGYFEKFIDGDSKYIAVLMIYTGRDKHSSYLRLYNSKGESVRELKFNKKEIVDGARLFSFVSEYNKLFLLTNQKEIREYDKNLKITNTFLLKYPITGKPKVFILNDEIKYVFNGKFEGEIVIINDDFSEETLISLPGIKAVYYMDVIKKKGEKDLLFISGKNYTYTISYERNIYYYLKFLIYAGIFGAVFVFVGLIGKTQKRRLEKKYLAERQIAELQIKAIKNQIDPHFTLNIINCIGNLFYNHDRDRADYFLGRYSKMLRNMLINSDKISCALEDELEQIESYLELEQYRLNNKFTYSLITGNDIDNKFKIPKNLIFTFVENGIKHGIRHADYECKLEVRIENKNSRYLISVRDNGIGRLRATKIDTRSTHKGLEILNEMLRLYYSITGVKINYKIDDLSKENGSGTLVSIEIPV